MKKSKKIAVSTVLLLSMLTTAFAVDEEYLGTLSYWHSEVNMIYRMVEYPYIGFEILSGNTFSQSEINTYLNHTKNQWTGYGMNMQTVNGVASAKIKIYLGKYNRLKLIYNNLPSGYGGYTDRQNEVYEGKWLYNENQEIAGYTNTVSHILVPWDTAQGGPVYTTTAVYKNVILHEVGHALGWHGHSSLTSDVMYEIASSGRTYLTSRDGNHVRQVKGY